MMINGQAYALDSLPLLTYLAEHKLSITTIALELNGKIVPKDELTEIVFQQGDVAEIVSFVGGG